MILHNDPEFHFMKIVRHPKGCTSRSNNRIALLFLDSRLVPKSLEFNSSNSFRIFAYLTHLIPSKSYCALIMKIFALVNCYADTENKP